MHRRRAADITRQLADPVSQPGFASERSANSAFGAPPLFQHSRLSLSHSRNFLSIYVFPSVDLKLRAATLFPFTSLLTLFDAHHGPAVLKQSASTSDPARDRARDRDRQAKVEDRAGNQSTRARLRKRRIRKSNPWRLRRASRKCAKDWRLERTAQLHLQLCGITMDRWFECDGRLCGLVLKTVRVQNSDRS